MTEPSPDDVVVTDSGGTMTRMGSPGPSEVPELASLESLRRVTIAGTLRAAGSPPYFSAGEVITWHYGASTDVLRVVRDDARGLVAWLPSGSDRVAVMPRDGRGMRDRSLADRARLAVALDYEPRVVPWRGPGLVRIAPTGMPWSVWYFRDENGAFEGHYVNLELVHERPVDGSRRVHTRDLTLDLWLENGDVWLKDADELEAGVAAGWCTERQAAMIHAVAAQARHELLEQRAWPLDEAWETWQPPPEWDQPLAVPDVALPHASKSVADARRTGGSARP